MLEWWSGRSLRGDYLLTLDPELLEAAQAEAERRKTSLDQMVADSLATFVQPEAAKRKSSEEREKDRKSLLELMNEGVLGDLGKLPTREEIYEERIRWPRS